ncbi:DUF4352 domain-containing protein [Alkalihalobacillus oceani]|uniref:DUF4352 domain-containing protein n=1 Tax=Halalkalibacter oceani TaxID=1653776 RepID=UPI00203A580B|nr:DUF4352 domain-containing protein [Halalkalibacter oceani]MCM3760710.1 DUF4352 domain-containing protein [Halalkalibacter oceani]
MMKGKVLLFLSLCLGLVVLIGYSGLNQSEGRTTSVVSSDGQGREVNGLEITLNAVRTEPSEEAGSHYVIADLTLENVRDTVYEFSMYKMTLVDQEGYAYNHVSSIETKGILGGQLHPGRTNRGEVAFLVPEGSQYELVYTDHLRTGQLVWDISLSEE